MSSSRGRRAHRRATPCGCWRRRSCAGSTCAATPSRPSTSTSAPRSSRLYDEWDSLARKAARPRQARRSRCSPASARRDHGRRPAADARTSSYRSALLVLGRRRHRRPGRADQPDRRRTSARARPSRAQPRLDKAMAWTSEYVDPADRTTVRESPDEPSARPRWTTDSAAWLRAAARRARRAAASSTPSPRWSTACPSWRAGSALDDKPTDEVKADQKEFFGLLYRLLVDAERGPRLPTLVMALGARTRVRSAARRLS